MDRNKILGIFDKSLSVYISYIFLVIAMFISTNVLSRTIIMKNMFLNMLYWIVFIAIVHQTILFLLDNVSNIFDKEEN